MRRMLIVLVALALALVGCSDSDSESTTAATSADETTTTAAPDTTEAMAEAIVIGFFGPLTGPTADAGNALLHGAELRVKQLNEEGGILDRPVELVTCDDKSEPEDGVTCAQRLIDQDGVDAIVGTLHSPIIAATAPIVGENEVPMVGAGTGVSWCNEGFQYVWRETANSDANAAAITQALQDSDWERLGVLYQNHDYGASGAESLAAIDGIEVVASETYNPADRDYSGQIIKLLGADLDVIGSGDSEIAGTGHQPTPAARMGWTDHRRRGIHPPGGRRSRWRER